MIEALIDTTQELDLPYLVLVMLAGGGLLVVILMTLVGVLGRKLWRARRAVSAAQDALDALEKTQRARRQTEERFRSLVLNTSDVITILAVDGTIHFHSPSAGRIWGYSGDALRNVNFFELVHEEDADIARDLIAQSLGRPRLSMSAEIRLKLADEGWCYFEIVATNLLRDPRVNGIVTTFRDITERKDFEQALRYQAFHDALTDLPNRTLFVDRVGRSLSRAAAKQSSIAVLFIDLDNFKVINDSLGHGVGDQLLVTLTERIKQCLRHEDTLARLSGDEFAILIEDLRQEEDAPQLANRVLEQLKEPFILDRREVYASVSIGIAVSGPDHAAPDDLLRDADQAMYRAKANGKARCEIYDETMNEQVIERLALETSMRRSIERNEMRVYYQPIVRLDNATVAGFEALVRWEHPERGLISPADFIPLAEETGMIVPIGLWVLEEACRQIQVWHEERCPGRGLMISVNVSARQFQSPDLVETIASAIERSGIDPRYLKLELTESMVMHDVERTIQRLHQLKALNLELSIDDFGTGYSSLAYLRRFPIDVLKVDKSFVHRIGTDRQDEAIVRSIVTLARDLGMRVVAEGIETADQLDVLCGLGCDYGQGYYFSRPVPAHQAELLLNPTAGVPLPSAIRPRKPRGSISIAS